MRNEHEHLWIAKFPSRNDRDDVGGWEMVVHRLAQAAGTAAPHTGTGWRVLRADLHWGRAALA